MPKLKLVTDTGGTKIYPVTIAKGVYDTGRNKRLSAVLDDCLTSIEFDEETGVLSQVKTTA